MPHCKISCKISCQMIYKVKLEEFLSDEYSNTCYRWYLKTAPESVTRLIIWTQLWLVVCGKTHFHNQTVKAIQQIHNDSSSIDDLYENYSSESGTLNWDKPEIQLAWIRIIHKVLTEITLMLNEAYTDGV